MLIHNSNRSGCRDGTSVLSAGPLLPSIAAFLRLHQWSAGSVEPGREVALLGESQCEDRNIVFLAETLGRERNLLCRVHSEIRQPVEAEELA